MATIPLTEAKARLNEIVDEALRTHERVTVTRHGRPAVVIIAADDLEALEETLFWQEQPGVQDDIEAARGEAAQGRLLDETTVRRRYGLGRAG